MGLTETQKAERYDIVAPGTDLPVEQRAERYERLELKERLGHKSKRRNRMPTKYFTFENASCWCDDCGKFKHEGNC